MARRNRILDSTLYSFTLEEPPESVNTLFKLGVMGWLMRVDVPEEVRSMISENLRFDQFSMGLEVTVSVYPDKLYFDWQFMHGVVKNWPVVRQDIENNYGKDTLEKVVYAFIELFGCEDDEIEDILHDSEYSELQMLAAPIGEELLLNITTNLDHILIDGIELKEENRGKIEELIFNWLAKELFTSDELQSSEELRSRIETAMEKGDLEGAQSATETLINYGAIEDIACWIADGLLSATSQVITITMPRCLLSLWEACKGSKTSGEFVKELLLAYGV